MGAGAVTHLVETWIDHTHLPERNINLGNKTIMDPEYDENPQNLGSAMKIPKILGVQNPPFPPRLCLHYEKLLIYMKIFQQNYHLARTSA
jgi:hypothetical protein